MYIGLRGHEAPRPIPSRLGLDRLAGDRPRRIDRLSAAVMTKTPEQELDEILARVEPTICTTISSRGESVEGRITLADFRRLIEFAKIGARRLH